MSDEMNTDLEATLGAWLASRAPADLPASLVARVRSIPSGHVPERRRRWSWLPRRGFGTARLMLVVAVAGVLLAAVAGGAVLTGSLVKRDTIPSAAPAVASAAPAVASAAPAVASSAPSPQSDVGPRPNGILPATIPEAIPHGVVATPLGRARWVHLSGDATTLPDPLTPSVGPNGTLFWFAPGGPGSECYNAPTSAACTDPSPARLWVSEDVLAPRVERPLPVEAAEANMRLAGGRYWFLAPAGVWWSSDLEAWQRTDLSGLQSPDPPSLSWTMHVEDLVTGGTATVASVNYTPTDPGSLLGYPGRRVRLATSDSGGYVAREFHLRRDGGDVDLEAITVTASADGLRFRNAAGREVGRVAGVGTEFARSWARRGEIASDQFVVLDGDRWSSVVLPGAPSAISTLLVDVGGAFVALLEDADEHVRVWRSSDGRMWTGGQVAATEDGTPLRASGGITYRDGADGRTLVVYGPDGSPGWASRDGIRWVDNSVDPAVLLPEQIPAGWVRTPVQTQDGSWQVSRDATAWVTVPELSRIVDKTEPVGAGGNSETALQNAILFTVEEGQKGTRDLWILEFEDVNR